MSNGTIRVLVADDHAVLRDGLRAIMESHGGFTVVGEASGGQQAVELHRSLAPDVTLMDLQMPDVDGIEAINRIRRSSPAARILVLTTYSGDIQAVRAIKAGALGYLLKSSVRTQLIKALLDVAAGRRHVEQSVAMDIAHHVGFEEFTDREMTVLQQIALGRSNKEVARELGLSVETVKGYVKTILAKLGAVDRTHAIALAARRGAIMLRS